MSELERLARAMCRELGYDYDTLYINKQDWTRDRGARHDINTPYQPDAIAAVRAILRELREPTEGMVAAGDSVMVAQGHCAFHNDSIAPFQAVLDHILSEGNT